MAAVHSILILKYIAVTGPDRLQKEETPELDLMPLHQYLSWLTVPSTQKPDLWLGFTERT